MPEALGGLEERGKEGCNVLRPHSWWLTQDEWKSGRRIVKLVDIVKGGDDTGFGKDGKLGNSWMIFTEIIVN